MSRRKICVVTGSRADYGHLISLLRSIAEDPALQLQIVATGSHLSSQQGNTYRLIEKDGFPVAAKVNILGFDDSERGVAKRLGRGCQGFADVFARLKPEIVVVLGDRYEILSATLASYIAKIPVAHLHGGEASEGVLDEGFRHAITKMSSLHFVATDEYGRRVIQLGEHPRRVLNFGAPGLDVLRSMTFLSKSDLSRILNFDLSEPVAIVTYHPVTLERSSAEQQLTPILRAIRASGLRAVFTKANIDAHGCAINRKVESFCRANPNRYKLVDNLGQQKYWSCLRHFDLMIGNSSSGIVEAPSFGLPVVNIGDRQKGRIRSRNIIDVKNETVFIRRAIGKALSESFRKTLQGMRNPYERFRDGRCGWRIKETLKKTPLGEALIQKKFFDIHF